MDIIVTNRLARTQVRGTAWREAADSGLTGDHGLISRTARVTLPARGGGEVTAPPSPRRAAS